MEHSEKDVQRGLLNKSLLEHARNGDWGLYRNDRYAMAEFLRKEQRFGEALKTYFEVCYIDLNGPNNTGGLNDPELLKEYPPFDPTQFADLAPGVIDIVSRLMKKLNLTKEDARILFLEHNHCIFSALKLPKSPEDSWPRVRDELVSS